MPNSHSCSFCSCLLQCTIIMGNETVQARRKNKNSFSVDFGHEMPGKIKPNTTNLKLLPLDSEKNRSRVFTKPQQSQDNEDKSEPQSEGQDKGATQLAQQTKKQNNEKLKKLNMVNDDLRRELIRISGELTQKLRKKKFEVKKIQIVDANESKKESWKKQLENAYKQIDMYKKLLADLKLSGHSEAKVLHLEDKIKSFDIQIEKTQEQIQATKNVTVNQSAGIRKDKGWETLEQLKSEIEVLKVTLKEKSKQQRSKEKQYLQQHHYMKLLEDKVKILNQEESESDNRDKGNKQGRPSTEDIKLLQAEIEQLKLKHDDYHKKINSFLTGNKLLKEGRKELKQKLQQTTKLLESLKYKRDAFVKQIKDNLHLFVTANYSKPEEQLSQFESEQEEQPDPIQEEEDERGTFDIEHLKDHQLKNKPKPDIINKESMQNSEELQRGEPKLWRKRFTRIIQKGKKVADEKPFSTGLKQTPKADMKIVEVSVWMSKKKQITAIQCSYLVDGRVFEGAKSSKNTEDEYKVTFELEEHDFLKSILGIIGQTGFLEYLVLQSNSGKISKIGRERTDGDNFAIGVAKEETPVQITGANREDGSYWRISRLEFEVLIDSNQ